jgi:hypothetical protein
MSGMREEMLTEVHPHPSPRPQERGNPLPLIEKSEAMDCRSLGRKGAAGIGALFGLLLLAIVRVQADQVEMQNGDRYAGKVVSLSSNVVVLESPILGTVRLPRGQVARLDLGAPQTNAPASPAPPDRRARPAPAAPASTPAANASTTKPDPLRELRANTNLIQQVQQQVLGDASPEATAKYNELLGGLMSGKLNVNDIRVQAQSAADQLRTLKRELGDEAGGDTLDTYLSILDKFVKETASTESATTNAAPPPAPTKKPQGPVHN